jgi:hypothetical protein
MARRRPVLQDGGGGGAPSNTSYSSASAPTQQNTSQPSYGSASAPTQQNTSQPSIPLLGIQSGPQNTNQQPNSTLYPMVNPDPWIRYDATHFANEPSMEVRYGNRPRNIGPPVYLPNPSATVVSENSTTRGTVTDINMTNAPINIGTPGGLPAKEFKNINRSETYLCRDDGLNCVDRGTQTKNSMGGSSNCPVNARHRPSKIGPK